MLKILRCIAVASLAVVLVPFGAVAASAGEPFPSRSIQAILAFPPGSIGTTMLRIGKGSLAASAALKAPRDGYTIVMLTSGNAIATAVSEREGKPLTYSVGDFTPLTGFAEFTNVVATAGDSRFKTMKEVLAYARANPGKLNVGVSLANTANDLAAHLLKQKAGIDFAVVRHSTIASLITEARQGTLDVIIQSYGALKGQFEAGALRPLAVTVAQPVEYLPNVPTVAASGVPGFDVPSWTALYVPKGVPPARVELLAREARASLASSEVQKRLRELGIRPIPSNSRETDVLMNGEIAKWREVLNQQK